MRKSQRLILISYLFFLGELRNYVLMCGFDCMYCVCARAFRLCLHAPHILPIDLKVFVDFGL